jgi:hypothetical protein
MKKCHLATLIQIGLFMFFQVLSIRHEYATIEGFGACFRLGIDSDLHVCRNHSRQRDLGKECCTTFLCLIYMHFFAPNLHEFFSRKKLKIWRMPNRNIGIDSNNEPIFWPRQDFSGSAKSVIRK